MPDPALDKDVDQQIKQCVELLERIFGASLLGIYLYGSSVVGGLQKYSDIDLLAVTARPTTRDDKLEIEGNLLGISGVYRGTGKRPIEVTIVVESDVNPWHYPPSFDLQYGEWLRHEFETGNAEPWPTKTKPDLALLITQVLLAGRTVYGADPRRLLAEIPYNDSMTAMTEGLDGLIADLGTDTRNVLLTLARILMTMETGLISSKPTAARWTIERLPEEHKAVLQRALKSASGEEAETWKDLKDTIPECVNFMIDRIRDMTKRIQASDNLSKCLALVV